MKQRLIPSQTQRPIVFKETQMEFLILKRNLKSWMSVGAGRRRTKDINPLGTEVASSR